MLIKSIELHNFRQYKHASLTLSSDKDRPFTIILGENGYGKTTFVRAFLWCLYQDNQFTDKALLNSDVLYEMTPNSTATVYVQMIVEHNNKTYKVITTENYKKNSEFKPISQGKPTTTVLEMTSKGAIAKLDSEARSLIEEILSPELKDYFFFDGESNKIDNVSSKKNLTSAVSDIMGLKRIEDIQKYFDIHSSESVVNRLNNQQKTDDPTEGEQIKEKLEQLNSTLVQYQTELENNKVEIEKLESLISDEEAIIDANQDVKEEQDRKIALDRKIFNEQHELSNQLQLIVNSVNTGLLKILLTDSFCKYDLKQKIDSSSFSNNDSWSHISEEVIDQILQRGECLCGQKISNNQDIIEHLTLQKEHMEPHDFGKYAANFCDDENQEFHFSSNAYTKIRNATSTYLDSLENYDTDKEEYEKIKRRIANKEDIGEHQKNADRYRSQKNRLEGRNEQIEFDSIKKCKDEIDTYQKKLDFLASKNDANKEIAKLLRYAYAVNRWASTKLKENKEIIRRDLQQKVSEIFASIYSGKRTIKIDENFYATTVVTDGTTNERLLDRSTGTETVKNFSFVCGIMDLVKTRLLTPENDDSPQIDDSNDYEYPFVVDAPFSSTDGQHIKNICVKLPLYCNQIIMFVMSSHYHLAEPAIGDRIGKIYHIERHSESFDEVKEGEY